jgi:hypothetical protein
MMLNRNINRRDEWGLEANGLSLKEWQDSQRAAVSDADQRSDQAAPLPLSR